MSLKKYLISDSGQVLMEYFILLTVVAVFTLLAGSYFYKRSKGSAEDFRDKALTTMNPDIGISDIDDWEGQQ